MTIGSDNEVVIGVGECRKPRFLCLHGFRTSGLILKKQVYKWPPSLLHNLDLVFVDAPFPSQGKSDVQGIFDPPFYEWFQFNQEFTTYTHFNECLDYIEELMIKHAPIDGLLGFSQGAILSAALPGLQAQGIALTKVPKVKFLIIIGGAKLKADSWAEKAYASPIQCPSLHFLGKHDFLKPHGEDLLKSVVDPFVIHHPKGHTVPRIDEQALPTMLSFIDKIQKMISEEEKESHIDAPQINGHQNLCSTISSCSCKLVSIRCPLKNTAEKPKYHLSLLIFSVFIYTISEQQRIRPFYATFFCCF